jgi:ethanolamine transporter
MRWALLAWRWLGVISLAPVLATILRPVVVPVYQFLGADPAMFATTLLANDMGGYPLAKQLAIDPEAGLFAGIILGAMMGPTIVFSIPVALGLIKAEDRKFLAMGVLAGMITIPIGCIAGGLVAGWEFGMLISNLVPVVIVAGLIALGLWRIPQKMTTGFQYFGRGVVIMITIGLAAIVWETLTGVVIIPGMAPVWDGIEIIGAIGIVLLGAFPMVKMIVKLPANH